MCYAYKPVYDGDGNVYKIRSGEFQRLLLEGAVIKKPDGYHYAKDTVGVLVLRDGAPTVAPMRWDLIPKDFMRGEKLDSCTVITLSSEGHALLKSIRHERIPLILTESQVGTWLDPKISPAQALQLCIPFAQSHMEAHLQAARDSKS
jgi:putative SOS response-associated peptidase YedK